MRFAGSSCHEARNSDAFHEWLERVLVLGLCCNTPSVSTLIRVTFQDEWRLRSWLVASPETKPERQSLV